MNEAHFKLKLKIYVPIKTTHDSMWNDHYSDILGRCGVSTTGQNQNFFHENGIAFR